MQRRGDHFLTLLLAMWSIPNVELVRRDSVLVHLIEQAFV
jgi:hypothetical protein